MFLPTALSMTSTTPESKRKSLPGSEAGAGWLVTGDFLEYDQGNRLQKSILGFGAGNEDASLYVTVSDLSRPKGNNMLNFNVDSRGNKAPGGGVAAVATHNPYSMAARFVLDRNASEKDIKRAGRQIAQQIEDLARRKY